MIVAQQNYAWRWHGRPVAAYIRGVRCDGRFPHWVDDYCTEAERYTVIVYSTDAREATAPVGAVDWQFLADEGPGP